MLSDAQRDFFDAFGYAVVDADRFHDVAPALETECERAIHRAYPEDPGKTLLLPAMSERNSPRSLDLVHDPRLLDTATTVLGTRVVVKPPKITRFAVPTNWHRDCYMPLRGVKFAMYFGRNDDRVPFDLIPGSHHGSVRDYVDRLFGMTATRSPSSTNRNPHRRLPPEVPQQTVRLQPGRMLMFDLGLWHANLSPDRRLQWAVTYLAAPSDATEADQVALHLGEFFEYAIPYPAAEYPYLPESWQRDETGSELYRAAQESGVWKRYDALFGRARDRAAG